MADEKKVSETVKVKAKDGQTILLRMRSSDRKTADRAREMIARAMGGTADIVVPVPEPEKPQ